MMKKLLITTAIIASFGISSANAIDVNNLLFGMETNKLSDNSAEYLVKGSGNQGTSCGINNDQDCANFAGIIEEGDKLRGILNIDTIENLSGGGTPVSLALHQELAAIFEIEIVTKSGSAGNFSFTFGASTSFQSELAAWGFSGTATDATVAFFTDNDFEYDRSLASTAAAEALISDGAAFWLFGFDSGAGADDFWKGTTLTDDIGSTSALTAETPFGSFAMAQTLLENPLGRDLLLRNCTELTPNGIVNHVAHACGNGGLQSKGPLSPTGFDSFDDVNFVISPIPEPASLGLLGLGLMGIGLVARRRK